MPTTIRSAASVLERFPDDWHFIVQLCKTDEDFRELCEHYSECQLVLARLRDSTDSNTGRVSEYETTTCELESEIRTIIAKQTGLGIQAGQGQNTVNPSDNEAAQ